MLLNFVIGESKGFCRISSWLCAAGCSLMQQAWIEKTSSTGVELKVRFECMGWGGGRGNVICNPPLHCSTRVTQ